VILSNTYQKIDYLEVYMFFSVTTGECRKSRLLSLPSTLFLMLFMVIQLFDIIQFALWTASLN